MRPKACLLAIQVKLRKIVASKLILDWSPEQISGWLKIQYPKDESMCVSHETIYHSLCSVISLCLNEGFRFGLPARRHCTPGAPS